MNKTFAFASHIRHHAVLCGTAAALLGAIQSVVGAAAAPLVGLGGEGSALPMAVVITGAAVASHAGTLPLARPRRATPGDPPRGVRGAFA